jgi:hypothetical protein
MRRQGTARRALALLALGVGIIATGCVPKPGAAPPDPLAAWRPFLECTIDHESRSSGSYWANTGNGYYGAYQFAFGTWQGAISRAGHGEYAGTPPVADAVPPHIQDIGAVQLAAERGAQPWGGRCSGLLP